MNQDDPEQRTKDELSAVAARLVEAVYSARDGDREATSAYIADAVALLRGKPVPDGRTNPTASYLSPHPKRGGLLAWQTRRVFAYVETNLAGRIQMQNLARVIGLSASHFCRAFKVTIGVSPREYVIRRRIELAKSLMLSTSEPLSAISAQCGMCDQAHFTRSFHRVVGQTPYTWRRSWKCELSHG